MEKISGIIPSSPRVSSVDLRDSSPVRPGTPSFGRAEGVSSLRDHAPDNPANIAQRSVGVQQNLLDWRSKEAHQAKVAQEVSDRFFAKNKQAAAPVIDLDSPSVAASLHSTAVSRPAGFKTDDLGTFRASSHVTNFNPSEDETPMLAQPEGLYPKGSFIDRTA